MSSIVQKTGPFKEWVLHGGACCLGMTETEPECRFTEWSRARAYCTFLHRHRRHPHPGTFSPPQAGSIIAAGTP